MPPHTRATRTNPPPGRIYESPQLPQQVKFKSRRQKVYGRHSLGSVKRKKQETLTQIGFVNALTDKEIDEEIEAYGREEKASSKRRKTMTPSSTFYTQTLTQLDFDCTPNAECRDSEAEDEDIEEQVETEVDERVEHVSESPVPRKRIQRQGIITVRCIKAEPGVSSSPPLQQSTETPHEDAGAQDTTTRPTPAIVDTSMPPPKTPTHKRTLEVPSSQTPATPLSTQSISQSLRTYDEHSPLKPRSTNIATPIIPSSIGKPSLPRQSQISTQSVTQDDSISIIPDSSPLRPPSIAAPTQSPSAQVLSEFSAASVPPPSSRTPRRRTVKTEIADSDADSDDDLGSSPPMQPVSTRVQVRSSPDMTPRRRPVLSSSPLQRPTLAVREMVRESVEGDELGSQWTRSQLLPESLMMDSSLAVPPVLGREWEE